MDFDINKLLDLDNLLDDGAIIVVFVEKKLAQEGRDRWTDHVSRRAHITVVDGVCIQNRWGKPGQRYDPEDAQKMADIMGKELVKIHYL